MVPTWCTLVLASYASIAGEHHNLLDCPKRMVHVFPRMWQGLGPCSVSVSSNRRKVYSNKAHALHLDCHRVGAMVVQ
ncbi:hypothetical protein DL89DRAFT_97058 [Linderina pennispora]|uniref:Uncharacterized protein n=1 Tax=Linderina pennispora TaxID=61395 RepID=A0A1Y1VXK1_9FUNG|nr:uncharacterized protein DL89DRAFT_97058 [Linderina pennispora]ORX65746.1 hypothetical protein DL89DRAFT_97058 [Linderina pennispora]